jgi:predicted restriction endonuclease
LASASNLAAVERVQELEDQLEADAVEQGIKGDESISQTEREQLVRSRIGQGKFRRVVQAVEKACRLTGVNDERFLIASHIKPWKDCNHAERLDGHNGLMLTPHVDKLFDRGWISFSDDGHVLISGQAKSVAEAWGLAGTPNVGAFSPKQQVFLKYHREKVFKGA